MPDGDGLFAGMTFEVDPELPAGTMDLRSGDSRLRMVLAGIRDDPGEPAAEEIASLAESKDFLTYPGEMTQPAPCEVCGTPVTFVPEVHVTRRHPPAPRAWEAERWRKHTPRRCSAMRRLAGG